MALGTYLAKRALRIVPAYYAVLLVVAAGLVPLYAVPQDVLAIRIAYHALFLQDYLPANIVVVFWSLPTVRTDGATCSASVEFAVCSKVTSIGLSVAPGAVIRMTTVRAVGYGFKS